MFTCLVEAPAGVWLMMVGRRVAFIWASSKPAIRKRKFSHSGSKTESHTSSASRSIHHDDGRNSPQPSRSNRNCGGLFKCCYWVAHLLLERDMLTPNLKLRSALNLSFDLGWWRNFEFDVNIFLSRSRWATLYTIDTGKPEDRNH